MTADQKNSRIKDGSTTLICVEGKDEENFIETFLIKHSADKSLYDIKDVGGSCRFKDKFPVLCKDPNFFKIKCLLIIRDAETSFKATWDSVGGILHQNHLPKPSTHGECTKGIAHLTGKELTVGCYVMPGVEQDGMLEDLCLEWYGQANPQAMDCLRKYEACLWKTVGSETTERPENLQKARSLMMLATTPNNAPSLGVAAKQGFFDFSSSVWQPLRYFLSSAGLISKS